MPLRTPGTPGPRPARVGTPPSRLYDRMRDEEPEPPSHAGIKWLIGLAVVAVVVIAAILGFRFGPWAKPEVPVPPTATTLPIDTLLAVTSDSTTAPLGIDSTLADTSLAMAPTTETTPAAPAPVMTPAPDAIAKPIVVAPPAVPRTTQEFSLSVGTYLDRARAESELARVAGASGLTGRIAELPKEDTMMYVVLLGAFPNRDAAVRKAGELVSSGTVDEARVLPRTVRTAP
jgi:hypothetical protein